MHVQRPLLGLTWQVTFKRVHADRPGRNKWGMNWQPFLRERISRLFRLWRHVVLGGGRSGANSSMQHTCDNEEI